jgi:hypothetical protein
MDIYGDLKLQKKRDEIKDDYCKSKGIKLYRIHYNDFNNIENILFKIIEDN